ncbi:MAG: uroporphyrinogen-III synthase [Shewanella sp.]|nr:uroporphyrinogen-III synthase [Shewanella sp.]MCF1430851.1 uroporphyrinogen-III synthase [Shewanella sp.]MCF1438396.1 uroporphyrinogen-III synthase [Shewanella sp.]MCF1456127.1 uroporphyrinogen-III synthase [Shewanella sp.]
MKVLLTRPEGRNQILSAALSERGIAHLIYPLMGVEATPPNLPQASVLAADIIIFVSTNAVHFGTQALDQPWPAHASYFAVGKATWDSFAKAGITGARASDDNQQTEGLLALPALNQVAGKRVVIVRGNGGRELLGQTLMQRGALVDLWEVYQRTGPQTADPELCRSWQTFGIDTILLTSPEMLESLITLVPKELFSWLSACHIIVPSSRAKAQAIARGLTHVTNAGAAHAEAMLALLK